MIEDCVVDPAQRRPGRTYERVQELLMEIYTLRQLAGLGENDRVPGVGEKSP